MNKHSCRAIPILLLFSLSACSSEVEWQETATSEARDDPAELFHLGETHYFGRGVAQDYGEAAKWFSLAAENGYDQAQFALGVMYANGQGVEKDDVEAVKLYRMAADQGHVRAQYNLSVSYRDGQGVARDQTEAVEWVRLSAEQGFAQAQFDLGVYYEEGLGVTKDSEESAKWIKLAAEQGLPVAQYFLSAIYINGIGLPKDEIKGIFWMKLAAEAGFEAAQERWAQGASEIPADQMAEVNRMAREWQRRSDEASSSPAAVVSEPAKSTVGSTEHTDDYEVEVIGSADAPHLFTVHFSVGCHHCLLQLDKALPSIRYGVNEGLIRVRLLESTKAIGFSGFAGVGEVAEAMYCIREKKPETNSIELIESFISLIKSSVAEEATVEWYEWFSAKPDDLVGVDSVVGIGARFLEQHGLEANASCISADLEERQVTRRFFDKGFKSVPTAEFDSKHRENKSIGAFLSRELIMIQQAERLTESRIVTEEPLLPNRRREALLRTEARNLVKEFHATTLPVRQSRSAQRKAIEQFFEIDVMGQLATNSRAWRELSDDNADEYLALYGELLNNSIDQMRDLLRGRDFRYGAAVLDPAKDEEWGDLICAVVNRKLGSESEACQIVVVSAAFDSPVPDNSFAYYLVQMRSEWRIVDVVVNGVSTGQSYKSQFRAMSRDWSDPDAMLARLRTQVGTQQANMPSEPETAVAASQVLRVDEEINPVASTTGTPTSEAVTARPKPTQETVEPPTPNIVLSSETVRTGQPVVVNVSELPGNPQDWVTLIKAARPDAEFGLYKYTNGLHEGTWRFTAGSPGDYEVRVYYDWPKGGYAVQARASITITE